MTPPPPPTLNEVVELALKVIGGLGAIGGPLLAVMAAYNKRQEKARADASTAGKENFAEAGRLRDELREENEVLRKERDVWHEKHDELYGQHIALREMFVRARLEILGVLDRAIERFEDRDNPAKLDRAVKLLESLRTMIHELQLPPLEER